MRVVSVEGQRLSCRLPSVCLSRRWGWGVASQHARSWPRAPRRVGLRESTGQEGQQHTRKMHTLEWWPAVSKSGLLLAPCSEAADALGSTHAFL